MKRLAAIFWKLLLLLVSLPLIKGFYDTFTAPGTGLFVTAGMDANGLAFFTAVPWVFPIIIVIMLVIDFTKKDEPKSGGFGGMTFK